MVTVGIAVAIRNSFVEDFSLLYALGAVETLPGVSEQGMTEAFEASLVSHFLPHADSWDFIGAEENEDSATQIIREAGERRPDLIAIDLIERLPDGLLISLVERIARTAPSPVLAVWADNYRDANPSTTSRILVATDFSVHSELALRYAVRLARARDSELHLLHVLLPQIGGAGDNHQLLESSELYHRAMRSLQSLKADKSSSRLKVEVEVRWGKPYREILSCAREKDVSLLCMGAQGQDFGQAALFGSNADRVLRKASCPVLLARPLKPLFTGR